MLWRDKMPRNCEGCKHCIVKYSPIYRGLVETCEFEQRTVGCGGQYEPKEMPKRRKKDDMSMQNK